VQYSDEVDAISAFEGAKITIMECSSSICRNIAHQKIVVP
jgi:hypothetical protein